MRSGGQLAPLIIGSPLWTSVSSVRAIISSAPCQSLSASSRPCHPGCGHRGTFHQPLSPSDGHQRQFCLHHDDCLSCCLLSPPHFCTPKLSSVIQQLQPGEVLVRYCGGCCTAQLQDACQAFSKQRKAAIILSSELTSARVMFLHITKSM